MREHSPELPHCKVGCLSRKDDYDVNGDGAELKAKEEVAESPNTEAEYERDDIGEERKDDEDAKLEVCVLEMCM